MSDTDKPVVPPPAPAPRPEPAPRPDRGSGRPPNLAPAQDFGAAPSRRELDAQIEDELQAVMGGLSDKELYGDPAKRAEGQAQPGEGQARKKGRVLRIHGPDVFIELPGGRSGGVLPMLQFPEGRPEIGSEVDVHIEGYDNANGLLILSRKGAAIEADWASVAVGQIVEARVTATNKGGLSVDVNGIRGFMPISQIDLYRVEDAEQYVNQRLRCLVAEVVPEERNLVVSRRALLEKEREEVREKLWQELAEGQTRSGIVRSIKPFGAFVDLGGVDGLVPIGEMSWKRINDPSEVVQLGQTVKVVILRIDREQRRLSLGLKQLTASPWDNIIDKYQLNSIVPGKVTRLMDFGAFVELEPAVEGLIHISELAAQRVRRVSDIVKPGQEVQVMVLRIDAQQRKISLSLKAALPKEPEPPAEEEAEEVEVEVKPPRPRTTPLRGGIGE